MPKLATLLLLVLLGVAPRVLAQPMMPDPAQMSGIPRPDPAVPSGTVTVRLLRGAFSNPIVDQEVTLTSPAGTLKARSDAAGRATFSGVPVGVYEARTELAGIAKSSQPIQVAAAPAPGIRVMLVFPKDTPAAATSPSPAAPSPPAPSAPVAGTSPSLAVPSAVAPSALASPPPPADGQVHPDAALPAGTLRIVVVDEGSKPLSGVPVTLYRRAGAEAQVEKLPAQNTGEGGAVVWAGMPTGPAEYLVTIARFGFEQPTEPFHLDATAGSALTVMSRPPVTGEEARRKLSLASNSHLIFDLHEDMLQVTEMLRINNPMPQAYEPGPEGLRIPLAEGAVAPQLAPGGPSTLSIDQSSPGNVSLVWKGPLPPGESMVQVGFMLRHTGELTFRQPASIQVQDLRVVIEKRPELKLDGVTDIQERKWQGHDLLFGQLTGTSEGGQLTLTITGLPSEQRATRLIGGAVALLILLGFLYLSWQGKPDEERAVLTARRQLLAKRDKLLGELLDLEDGPSRGARPREQVMAELTTIYRQLDEADAS